MPEIVVVLVKVWFSWPELRSFMERIRGADGDSGTQKWTEARSNRAENVLKADRNAFLQNIISMFHANEAP